MSTSPTIADVLAARIKRRRDELILTQREAAERLGVSERTFQNWEAAASLPRPKHRRALEAFLEGRSHE